MQDLGPEACAPCHASQYDRQTATRHAAALRPILRSALPSLLVGHSFVDHGGASFEYTASPDGVAVTARRDDDQRSALLEWAFGAGKQGITPVGRFEGRYFEHRLSWYEEPKRLGVTFGHPVRQSGEARSALGLIQSPDVIYRCFRCHATGVEHGSSGPDLASMLPGVTCDRCHGPGRSHVEAVRANRPKQDVVRAILNPGRFPAKAQVEMCGECHRLTESDDDSPAPEMLDPIVVRFQPVGLMASRCFLVSRNLSCLRCHDPHENARHPEQDFYTTRCLQCHKTRALARSRCRRNQGQNCLPCHMRRTSPAPYLSFTDHRIRIY